MIWFVLIAVCFVIYLIYLNTNTKNLPPAPFILPIIGNLYVLRYSLESFIQLHKKHGPIVRLQLGKVCTIVISDAELFREAFLQKGNIYSGRPHLPNQDLLLGNDVVGSDYGPHVKKMRKVVLTLMRQATESKFESIFQRAYSQLFQILDSYANAGEPVEMRDYLVRTSMAGALKITFNIDEKVQRKTEEDSHITNMLRLIDNTMDLLGSFDLSSYYPQLASLYTNHRNSVVEFTKARDKFLEEIVRTHIADLDYDNPKDWIDEVLIATKDMPDRDTYFNSNTISYLTWDMLLGGTDTTSATLTWVCLLLAHFPEVQRKVQNEVKTVLQGRSPGKADMSKLRYVNAVIKETMRFRPILPFLFPHRTIEDDNLFGYRIPKDAQILPNSYAYHLSEKYFPNPEQFNPDRFMDPDHPANEVRPFGVGFRQCAGQIMGEFQIFYATSTLMQRFTFKPVPGKEVDIMKYEFNFILRALPYSLIVEKINQ